MINEEELSVSAMHRIIKKARAERVSESACIELASVLKIRLEDWQRRLRIFYARWKKDREKKRH